MPIDASIPLQVQPPQFMGPAQAMSLQNLAQQRQMQGMEMQQMQQDRQEKNALRQLLQQPGIIDPATGTINPKAYGAVMKAAPMHGQKIVQDSNATALRLSELNIQKMKQYHDWDNENILEHGAGMISQYDADLKAYGPERSGRDYEMAKHKVIDEARKSGAYPPEYVDHLERKFGPVGIENFRGIYTRLNPQADPHKDQTPFTKELIAAGYKQGTPEFNRQLQKHIDKMDAPARTTINMGAGEDAKLQPDELNFMAKQALRGDTSVFQNIGRGKQGAGNIAGLRREMMAEAKRQGIRPEELAAINAEFQGLKAGERTLGTRTANIEMAVTEAQNMAPLALSASEKVDRTKFPALNSVILASEKGVGGEDVVRLGVATNSLINIYSRAISPTGVPTVSDKDHARELLSSAWGKGQYKAGVDQLMLEMEQARKSPGQVRKAFREAASGNEGGAAGRPDKPWSDADEKRLRELEAKHGS